MRSKWGVHLSMGAIVCLVALAFAGCKEEAGKEIKSEKGGKLPETVSPEALKALPTVTLIGTKVLQDADKPVDRVEIAATGPFGSNVVEKTDPQRIIVILHNAKAGDAPKFFDVNDGTVTRVEIAQLDAGKNPAVRITIGLAQKTAYEVIQAVNGLFVDIQKKK